VLDAALEQLPVDPAKREVICRTDAGGTSHTLAAACRERYVRFIGGVQVHAPLAGVILALPQSAWQPTVSADGSQIRETGEVAEITDLVGLSPWPPGSRMLVRREQPHPGAQLRFTDVDGYRYQVFVTDLPDADLAYLEALYRGRGRMECRIRDAKDTGLANLPSHDFTINTAWLALVLIAADLLAWLKALCLQGELANAEPKRLRYTLLHTAGVLVRSARRTTLRLAVGWPWATDLLTAFARLPGWAPAPADQPPPPAHHNGDTTNTAQPRPQAGHHPPPPNRRIHTTRPPTPTQRARACGPSSEPLARPLQHRAQAYRKIRAKDTPKTCADSKPAWCNTFRASCAIDCVVMGPHGARDEPEPRWSNTMQVKRCANRRTTRLSEEAAMAYPPSHSRGGPDPITV
jgi:hypothetical protein